MIVDVGIGVVIARIGLDTSHGLKQATSIGDVGVGIEVGGTDIHAARDFGGVANAVVVDVETAEALAIAVDKAVAGECAGARGSGEDSGGIVSASSRVDATGATGEFAGSVFSVGARIEVAGRDVHAALNGV